VHLALQLICDCFSFEGTLAKETVLIGGCNLQHRRNYNFQEQLTSDSKKSVIELLREMEQIRGNSLRELINQHKEPTAT
jgi:hypothetical protein